MWEKKESACDEGEVSRKNSSIDFQRTINRFSTFPESGVIRKVHFPPVEVSIEKTN
jgi:hypothetical protein